MTNKTIKLQTSIKKKQFESPTKFPNKMFSVRTWITFVFVGLVCRIFWKIQVVQLSKKRQSGDRLIFEPQTEMEGKTASCGTTIILFFL